MYLKVENECVNYMCHQTNNSVHVTKQMLIGKSFKQYIEIKYDLKLHGKP